MGYPSESSRLATVFPAAGGRHNAPMRPRCVHRAAVFWLAQPIQGCVRVTPTGPWVTAIRPMVTAIRVDQDGDSVGWAQDGAESNAAFRSPPAAVAASWAVVSNVAADDFAALAACTV